MTLIIRLFFERPLLLTAICIGAGLFLIWRWLRLESRAAGRAVLVWFVAAVGLLALSIAVETQREQIEQVCRELGRAVDEGDVEAIGSRIGLDFAAEELDREGLLSRVAETLSRVRLDQVRIRRIEVGLKGEREAVALLDVSCQVRSVEGFSGLLPSRWRVMFRRVGEQWVVIGVESVPVPPLNLRRIADWMR